MPSHAMHCRRLRESRCIPQTNRGGRQAEGDRTKHERRKESLEKCEMPRRLWRQGSLA